VTHNYHNFRYPQYEHNTMAVFLGPLVEKHRPTDWYTLYSNIHCSSLKRQDQNVLYHTTAMLAIRTSTGLKLLKLYASVPLMLLAWLKVKFVLRPRITEKTLLITQHVCVCCVCVCLLFLCVLCCVVCMCTYVMLASSIINYCITFKFIAES